MSEKGPCGPFFIARQIKTSGVCGFHAARHLAETVVHMSDFARYAGRQIGEQERCDITDFLSAHIASHWRIIFDELQDFAKT